MILWWLDACVKFVLHWWRISIALLKNMYDFWMDDNIMVKNCINKLRGKETKAIVV
jgi:hypothetical protein